MFNKMSVKQLKVHLVCRLAAKIKYERSISIGLGKYGKNIKFMRAENNWGFSMILF